MDYKQTFLEWLNSPLPDGLHGELTGIQNDDAAIRDRFSGDLEFRTAGMRGVLGAGTLRMNRITVNRATKGLADYISSLGENAKKSGVVIAYDTRRYSFEFALSAAEVLSKNGIKAFLFEDVRPVPMGSFAIRYLKAAAGIIITASHNPKEYNGYKVYGADGAQMGIEATEKVVEYINAAGYFPENDVKKDGSIPRLNDINATGKDGSIPCLNNTNTIKKDGSIPPLSGITAADIKGKDGMLLDENITVIGGGVDEAYYAEISKLALSADAVKAVGRGLKLVYTPLHGSGYIPVTTALKRAGINAEVVEEQKNPDFDFSTVSVPNPEQPDALRLGIALAKKIGADVVLGTDPDCDRMGAAVRTDDGYELLTGNQIGALLLDYILARKTEAKTLPKNAAAVKTIVTTELAAKIARAYGADITDVLTGFKFIGEKIKEWEQNGEKTFIFGYEESYGYLAGTHARDKDAVVAAMLFSEMLCYYQYTGTSVFKRLNDLYARFGFFVEKSLSIAYAGADAMSKMSATMKTLRAKKIFSFGGADVDFIDDYIPRERLLKNGEKRGIDLPQTDVLYYGLKGGGFVCVRPSGTEPKLKIYVSVSGENKADAAKFADGLLNSAAAEL
ncbi:MAG: phospho-sugar mutase [Clostridiales bacterium]|jgi:phosphoglucomutase|nr:phospho-sugar mutase [Clostridiales bacterium]